MRQKEIIIGRRRRVPVNISKDAGKRKALVPKYRSCKKDEKVRELF